MIEVRWRHAALEELTAAWLEATAQGREAISAAAHEIDRVLARDPGFGESRAGEDRIGFVAPLAFLFEVREQDRVLYVSHVWRVRSRSDG